jgi:AAA+ ATPase superfamily predicted ATPase
MMSTFRLVTAAVGDSSLPQTEAKHMPQFPHFDIYDVHLPRPDFSGIPTNWVFAVLIKEKASGKTVDPASILAEAHRIITSIPHSKLIVLVSDDPTIHLADEFGNTSRDVFCLDYHDLPATKEHKTQPRLAPFVLAVRRRLDINPIISHALSPYQRNKPASGWRFFGRSKQLVEIMEGDENVVVVGARRVGKTSLMLEAERRLREQGVNVYYVDVQDCRSANEVVGEVARVVSPREAARAFKHHEVLHDSVFSTLLKQMSANADRTVLLLDELGNVISQLPKEDWTFIGLLRKYGARTGMKVVMSCFQEVYFKQQTEFGGPLINFANTLRLEVFTHKEVEEFVVEPLSFWKGAGNRQELVNLVMSRVGAHPYFLQFFCHALFQRLTEKGNADPVQQAHLLLERDIDEWFSSAFDEIFFRIPSPAIQYLFLRRCQESEIAKLSPSQAEFSDEWVEAALLDLGYRSTIRGRRNLLDGLELHGLCTALDQDRTKKVVAAPLVYQYSRKTVSGFETWLKKLGREIERERQIWDLESIGM